MCSAFSDFDRQYTSSQSQSVRVIIDYIRHIFLADGTHPVLPHMYTPFSPTGTLMSKSGRSHPLVFSFVRADVLASCSP